MNRYSFIELFSSPPLPRAVYPQVRDALSDRMIWQYIVRKLWIFWSSFKLSDGTVSKSKWGQDLCDTFLKCPNLPFHKSKSWLKFTACVRLEFDNSVCMCVHARARARARTYMRMHMCPHVCLLYLWEGTQVSSCLGDIKFPYDYLKSENWIDSKKNIKSECT